MLKAIGFVVVVILVIRGIAALMNDYKKSKGGKG